MTTFSDLQQVWHNQPAAKQVPLPDTVIQQAEKHIRTIQHTQRLTVLTLLVTVGVLVLYFIRYGNGGISSFTVGLSMMIGSLLVRSIIELISFRQSQKIDIMAGFQLYTERMIRFYQRRKTILLIVTPASLLLYIIGFVLLLPVFRTVFSTGFYWYLVLSGSLFFLVFSFVLVRSVKKEMQLLRFLHQVGKMQ